MVQNDAKGKEDVRSVITEQFFWDSVARATSFIRACKNDAKKETKTTALERH